MSLLSWIPLESVVVLQSFLLFYFFALRGDHFARRFSVVRLCFGHKSVASKRSTLACWMHILVIFERLLLVEIKSYGPLVFRWFFKNMSGTSVANLSAQVFAIYGQITLVNTTTLKCSSREKGALLSGINSMTLLTFVLYQWKAWFVTFAPDTLSW